jgi:hypothetical protein
MYVSFKINFFSYFSIGEKMPTNTDLLNMNELIKILGILEIDNITQLTDSDLNILYEFI